MNLVKLNKLLEKSGFCLWADEPHAPPGAVVDWSSDYDAELLQLVELVILDCANRAAGSPNNNGHYYTGRKDAAKIILESWDLE